MAIPSLYKKTGVKAIRPVAVRGIKIGPRNPVCLIAGPCVIESEESAFLHAGKIKRVAEDLKIPFVFKASYDKANRTSVKSFRGPGLKEGLRILAAIRRELNIPVLSDVHTTAEMESAGRTLDVIQIPAFLCRQTDLLVAAGETGKVINIKKGQFLSPEDMIHAARKVESTGNRKIIFTERGASFGYGNLVSDFRSIVIMRELGYPVIFDATHSVQRPGGLGHATGGDRQFVPALAKASVAVGADGVFMEVHAHPDRALSDGPNSVPMRDLKRLLLELGRISGVSRNGS